MIESKKNGYIFIAFIIFVLAIFLYLPFPLSSYFVSVPIWEEQIGNGVLSEIYVLLYGWWLPELPESNVYKSLFLDHMEQVCLEHPTHCKAPAVKD